MRQVPMIQDHALREFLIEIKSRIEYLHGPGTIGPPSNITVTPGPGSNFIQFTAGDNADRHLLYISESGTYDPTVAGNYVVDMGGSTVWTDHVGRAAIKRYYWIVAVGRGGLRSDPPTGPTASTTLSLTVPGSAPRYVPPALDLRKSNLSNRPDIVLSRAGGRIEQK